MKRIIILAILILSLSSCASQEEKKRDVSRIATLQSIAANLETYYMDNIEYPKNLDNISSYKDPKEWETINGCTFWYKYEVLKSKDWIENGAFRLSTCLESASNQEKAKNDWGIYDDKFEVYSGL